MLPLELAQRANCCPHIPIQNAGKPRPTPHPLLRLSINALMMKYQASGAILALAFGQLSVIVDLAINRPQKVYSSLFFLFLLAEVCVCQGSKTTLADDVARHAATLETVLELLLDAKLGQHVCCASLL